MANTVWLSVTPARIVPESSQAQERTIPARYHGHGYNTNAPEQPLWIEVLRALRSPCRPVLYQATGPGGPQWYLDYAVIVEKELAQRVAELLLRHRKDSDINLLRYMRFYSKLELMMPSDQPQQTTAPTSAPAPTAGNKRNEKFTSRDEALAWMTANGIERGDFQKIDTELYNLSYEPPQGREVNPAYGWYLDADDKPRYTTSDDPDMGYGLNGPYTRAYIKDALGLSDKEIRKAEREVTKAKPPLLQAEQVGSRPTKTPKPVADLPAAKEQKTCNY